MLNFYLCFLLVGIGGFTHSHHVPGHHGEDEDDHNHTHPPPAEDPDYLSYQKIARSNANFAFKIFHQIVSEPGDQNVFFSPFSISTAFAMLSIGARSTTQSQLFSGLGFNLSDISEQDIHNGFHYLFRKLNTLKAELALTIGNALFTCDQVELLEKFVNDAKNYYQAEVLPVNFNNTSKAEEEINSYIENKTHIKDVVKGLGPDTVIVLINYVFLKAYWEKPFNYELTREADFFVDEQTTVKVPMMSKDSHFKTYHDTDLSCQVLQLPYKGGISALFILPDQGKLKQVEDALNTDLLLKWSHSLQERRIELYLPSFSISPDFNVKNILQKLGIRDVFEDYGDLSGITGKPNLKVSKAIHQTYLNVHENGTEAAAVTFIEIVPTSLPPILRLDRPFLLIIHEIRSHTILFMGEIRNPKKN